MIYSNTSELLALLKGEKIWAQKKLGQNFLVNPDVLKNIIKAAELTHEDDVLEVGPGLGILTEQLARHAAKVTAIEFDQNIIPVLRKNLLLEGINNVEIRNEDALKTVLPTEPYKLVANIPYYITSPLLNHFLQTDTSKASVAPHAMGHSNKVAEQHHVAEQAQKKLRPKLIVLLIQKEVAEKICAPEGEHSVLSLQVQAFGEPKIICTVGKSSFFPQPKVDSAVIKIQTYPQPKISNTELFFKLIKGAFHQKRKMLSNSLPNALKLTRDQADELFTLSKIAATERPQNLGLEQWEALINAYGKI